MQIETRSVLKKQTFSEPPWLAGLPSAFATLWKLASFQCLFWEGLGAHLSSDKPEDVHVCLRNSKWELKSQHFYKFKIDGARGLPNPTEGGKLAAFDANTSVWVNQTSPVGFTHGAHFSTLLPLLTDGAHLSKAVRTKGPLAGAWVAQEGDFETCDLYAGPEQLGGEWVQIFLVGRTWDLKTAKGHKTYKCIRSKEGHVCTHVLLRIWPNRKEENQNQSSYHYRPPGGLNDLDTEAFKKRVLQCSAVQPEQRELDHAGIPESERRYTAPKGDKGEKGGSQGKKPQLPNPPPVHRESGSDWRQQEPSRSTPRRRVCDRDGHHQEPWRCSCIANPWTGNVPGCRCWNRTRNSGDNSQASSSRQEGGRESFSSD